MPDFNTFTYGDRCSDEFGIYCDVETLYILPTQKSYTMDMPFMDGNIDFEIGGYDTRNIQLKLYYFGNYKDLRANKEKIMAWLASVKGQYKKLYLGTDNKYYKAKILSAFDFAITDNREIGVINFTCNPPWQFDADIIQTPEQILWNNQDRIEENQWFKKFSTSGNFRITNDGATVKPMIKIFGDVPKDLQISNGTQKIKFKEDIKNATIIVDCENETITNNGIDIFDKLAVGYNDYFEFESGQIELLINSNKLSVYPKCLYVIIEFDKIVGV